MKYRSDYWKGIAQEFWSDLVVQHGLSRVHEILDIGYIDPNIGEPDPEDYSYENFIARLKEKDSEYGDPNCIHMHEFNLEVSPSIPWDEINESLQEINIYEEMMHCLVFALKPFNLEKILKEGYPNLKEITDRVCKESNMVIKRLSTMLAQIQNILSRDHLTDVIPLQEIADRLQGYLAYHHEIVKRGRDAHERYMRMLLLNKNRGKTLPQKHQFWNLAVSGATSLLNRYYHTQTCEYECQVTHTKAVRKVADLLKILYPTIWTEDTETITQRIRQKDYRQFIP